MKGFHGIFISTPQYSRNENSTSNPNPIVHCPFPSRYEYDIQDQIYFQKTLNQEAEVELCQAQGSLPSLIKIQPYPCFWVQILKIPQSEI